jgi:hypothetical protein
MFWASFGWWLQQRAWDCWFAPKRFESPHLYEGLGVLWIKRYVPTGGDYFRKKYGVRVIAIKSTIESLLTFEQRTRFYEAIPSGGLSLPFSSSPSGSWCLDEPMGLALAWSVWCTRCSFFHPCCCNAITASGFTRRYVA